MKKRASGMIVSDKIPWVEVLVCKFRSLPEKNPHMEGKGRLKKEANHFRFVGGSFNKTKELRRLVFGS